MKIRETLELADGRYHASLTPVSLTEEEDRARSRFGSWSIETGGQFDDQQGLSFELPSRIRSFPEQFPTKTIVDLVDFPDARARAGLWLETVRDRIILARDQALTRDPGTVFDQVNEYLFEE
jgi:hypothetical protein